MPRLSIIISAYNCEEYIKESIDSILDQTYKDFEIIIADDGSKDNTRKIIDRIKDPRIKKYHNQKNIGLLKTWNKLIEYSQSDFLAWQDADDISNPTRLEKQVKALEDDSDLMLIGTNFVRHYPNIKRSTFSNFPLDDCDIKNYIDQKHQVPFIGASKMIRRKVFDHVELFRNFFDRLGWEDFDLILRISEKFKVKNLSEHLYEYRYVSNSASRYINENLYLKPFINEVGFFLYEQRKLQYGLDGLMPNGPQEDFINFLNELKIQIEKKPSLIYQWSCKNKINNYDLLNAGKEIIYLLKKYPLDYQNWILLLKILRSSSVLILKNKGQGLINDF